MRLFIAMNFPPEVLRDLNARVSSYRSRLPSGSWVKPESQHLTLAFLGEQSESILEPLGSELVAAARRLTPFEARLRGCGFFPNPRHARVGWIGLEPESNFLLAGAEVREATRRTGIALDGSEMKPHLTLVRIRDRWPPASVELFTRAFREYRSEPFITDTVTLFSSQLQPSGAIHSPLRVFRFAG